MTTRDDDEVIGTMVVCLSCQQIIWAYDADFRGARGLANTWRLPCPECGVKGTFDGWGLTTSQLVRTQKLGHQVFDGWSFMKWIAARHGYAWCPSPDNTWRIPHLR